ncbi:AIPR family protein [Neptuniibacter sp. SY11_33]|uniref:AIPR family protein n=1 Tax=Neptuniibacter sp. SY11_33 TaxID=3398215 RepID=UPI0039F6383C
MKFTIECEDYRTLRIPNSSSQNVKLGTLFVKIEDLPEGLVDWMEVNPRSPKYTKGGKLSGSVSRSIVKTLQDEPELFSLKNLGIYLLVDEVHSQRVPGDRHSVEIELTEPKCHGIVNGGHTFSAIRQVLDSNSYKGGAFVRLHLYMNVPSDDIVELAEGLNKNLQVDDTSLNDLREKFEPIKEFMKGKKGASSIAYASGDDGDVDILDVLHILSCFDLSSYPAGGKHPNDIFGNKSKILNRYCEDIDIDNGAYSKLIKKMDEFLILSDEIQKRCATITSYYKIKNTSNHNRVGSDPHKKPAVFSNGEIGGYIPQGWLYPMLSAFRANLSMDSWNKGEIRWLMDPNELLEEIINKLVEVITELHKEHKNKPGEVGRKPTAYDMCYSAAFMALAMKGKIELNA